MPSTVDAPASAILVPSVSESATLRLGFAGRLRIRERLWTAPHLGRNTLIALGLFAFVANVLWMLGLERVMLATSPDAGAAGVIQVTIIEPLEPLPIPDEPQPAVFQRKPSRIAIAPPETRMTAPPVHAERSSTTTARIGSAGEATVNLFNADGSLRMPEAKLRIGPEEIANPQQAAKARWAEIETRGENPLDCKRTRFAGAFRRDESAGDEVARKYLSWIGLADGAGIAERHQQREGRAADGCDPAD